ncbi:MAG: hypothetical protein WB765_03435 [Acidimicrobiales bacterium]
MNKFRKRIFAATAATALTATGTFVAVATIGDGGAAASVPLAVFQMVRSTAAVNSGCLPSAQANVIIKSLGPAEAMVVSANNLPPNTDFDFFVNQVPNAPFGLSWYQGDLQTDSNGHASGTFIGRFSIETFTVAPGVAPAPVVFPTDASANPATAPVQMYHLGLWFNSPVDAFHAGCQASPTATTPFNGEHNAGTQALSTRNFPDDHGPLRNIQP